MAEAGKAAYSLRRAFLFRLLVLLIPLALATLAGAYWVTLHYANEAFDRSLARRVYPLADQVEVVHGKVVVDLPQRAHDILEFDPTDILYFRVTGPKGELLAGTEDLPLPARFDAIVSFRRDTTRQGGMSRWQTLDEPGAGASRSPST